MQQSEITRSLASETLQLEQSLHEQLLSERQVLALTGWIENVDDPTHAPQLSRLLQDFVGEQFEYSVRDGGKEAGQRAIGRQLQRGPGSVRASGAEARIHGEHSGSRFVSEPFALGQDNRPALVMSVPLLSDGQFSGMFAAVVSLEQLQAGCRMRACATGRFTLWICMGTSSPIRIRGSWCRGAT